MTVASMAYKPWKICFDLKRIFHAKVGSHVTVGISHMTTASTAYELCMFSFVLLYCMCTVDASVH